LKFKIFISYTTDDLPDVDTLKRNISDSNLEIFIAEYSVKLGEDLKKSIHSAINDCDLFVVLYSTNSSRSPWVQQEIGKAEGLNKEILPIVKGEIKELPGFINGLKYIRIDTDPQAIMKIRDRIMNLYSNKYPPVKVQNREQKTNWLPLIGLGALIFWLSDQ